MDDVVVVNNCVLHVLGEGLAGNGEAVAVQFRQEFLQQCRHTACEAEVVHGILGAARRDVCKERDVVGRFVEVFPPRFVITGLVCDCRDMENQVRRCSDGHIHLDCVADGLGSDDPAGGDSLLHHVHNALSGLIGNEIEFAGSGGNGRVAWERHSEGLCHHAH